MMIENLTEGQWIKNYPALCEVLCIKKCGGSSGKQKQLAALAEGVQFRQIKQGFMIDKIIKKVEMIDKRTFGNNSKHIDNIEYMILTLLSKLDTEECKRIGFSRNRLYNYCGLANDNYSIIKGNTLSYSQSSDIPIQVINECLDSTNRKMLKTLLSALNRLKKQKILSWSNGYSMIFADENNNQYSELADDMDIKLISYAELTALNNLGYENKRMAFLGGDWNSFKKESTEELQQMHPNLKFYYENITFEFEKECILNALSDLGEKDEQEVREKVNTTFSKSLDASIKRKHEKFKNTILNEGSSSLEKYAQSDEFISQQKSVKNILVNINEPTIDLDIKYDGQNVKKLRDGFNKKYSCV